MVENAAFAKCFISPFTTVHSSALLYHFLHATAASEDVLQSREAGWSLLCMLCIGDMVAASLHLLWS